MTMLQSPTLTIFETSSGARIHRLPLEAFPKFWVYAYLVQTGDNLVLVDTGSGSESSNAGLQQSIAAAGYSLDDLTHILLTHGHIDHYGGLAFLREHTRALIGVHELDYQTVCHHEARLALMSRKLAAFLNQAGVPGEQGEGYLQMYRFTKALHRSTPVDFTYEAQGMRLGAFEVIHLPGHCPGHVAIKLQDVIFCGDLVLDGLTPHQSPEELAPFSGVRHYLDSLSVFECWADGATLTLNGHSEPITDLPARIAHVRKSLSRRIWQTLEAASTPRTLAEITEQVYGDMNGYNALLVIEKIGAYVEYLYQRGLVEIVNAAEIENNPLSTIQYRRIKQVSESEILPKEEVNVFFRTQ